MKIIIGILMSPWIAALRGLVLVKLWHWFVVPLGAKDLRIPIALGISVIVTTLTANLNARQEEEKEWWMGSLKSIAFSLISLGMGWIYAQFL